jgi:peptide/nickel transport system substrate-binding protein
MREFRWQILIAIGGLLLIIGLLLNRSPNQPPALPEPASGGVHVEGVVGRMNRLNPVLDFNNQVDADVDRLLFRGLIRFDSRGNPVPDLADSLSVSADSTLVTVSIRQDATWHDGEPVEAADVVYTFSKFKDDGYSGPSDLHDLWKEIKIVLLDEHTVQFQLPEPYAPFLDFLSVGLLPDHLLRGVDAVDLPDHPFNLEPVGTGPFLFDRFLRDGAQITGVSLRANPDFYGQVPYLDRVEFRYFDSTEQALEAYQQGETSAIGTVDSSILPEVLAEPSLNLHSARIPQVKLVYLNLASDEKPFMADREVRHSLLQAINRQGIIDLAIGGQGIVADGPILPGTWAFSAGLEASPFDPIAAASVLDEQGWELPEGASQGGPDYIRSKEGEDLSFELLVGEDRADQQIASMLQAYWAKIGVEVSIKDVDPETMLSSLQDRDYQAALTNLTLSRFPDPDPYPFWHDSQAETGQNYSGYTDRNSGIWLERARTNPDQARRAELYNSFQYRFNEQVPALLLYYPIYNYAISNDVRGLTFGPIFDPSDRFRNIEEWYLLTRRGPVETPSPAPSSTP